MNDHDSADEDRLAELERVAEAGAPCETTGSPDTLSLEHRQCYDIVDRLTASVRSALSEPVCPPSLAEYETLEEIGRGGMGVVYRAIHQRTRRLDAIKVIRSDRLVGDTLLAQALRSRFVLESQLASKVSHEHIVPVYQVGEVNTQPWFSMQWIDGSSLNQLLRDRAISRERGVWIVERIARAIDTVHRHGILHGDIKPHNIFVERDTNRPMIGDFGLSQWVDEAAEELSPAAAGTLAYMAPELLRGGTSQFAAHRTIASDVYSLGATLAAVLSATSHPSGQSIPVERATSAVPAFLANIACKCIATNAEDRYQTADLLADDLARWLNRPRWNRYFPSLPYLLKMLVAPWFVFNGATVWLLLQSQVYEYVVWLALFAGYLPVFGSFLISQRIQQESERARRELWSVWLGHCLAASTCMVALRILSADLMGTLQLFYPCLASLSSIVFFAKSGNFWTGYRVIGVGWAAAAVVLAIAPASSALLFGLFAASTCLGIAWLDKSFDNEPLSS